MKIQDFEDKIKEKINYCNTKEDIDDFNIKFTHKGNDGEYEVFALTAEHSYDWFSNLFDYLNPIAEEIDEDAYFDMEDIGRAVIYISAEKFKDNNIELSENEMELE